MALTVVDYSESTITGHRKKSGKTDNLGKLICLPDQPHMLRSIKAACQYIVIILVKLFSIQYFQHQVIFDSIDENLNFIAIAPYFLF